jgi:dihydrofolate reductase
MSKLTATMSMSLDGFIAGPNDSVEQGLGENGERLHEWLADLASFHEHHGGTGGEHNPDSDLLEAVFQQTGAVVMGRRLFDLAVDAWGPNPPFRVPVFVVTHRGREPLAREGGTTFYFVTDGIESALRQATAAAGDKNVAVGGGANIIQQYLRAGLLDEIQVELVPLLLGAGKRLFDQLGPEPIDLEITRVIPSRRVTHLLYRVVK